MEDLPLIASAEVILGTKHTLFLNHVVRAWLQTPVLDRSLIEINLQSVNSEQPKYDLDTYQIAERGVTLLDFLITVQLDEAWEDVTTKAAAIITLKLSDNEDLTFRTQNASDTVNEIDTLVRELTGDNQTPEEIDTCERFVRLVRKKLDADFDSAIVNMTIASTFSVEENVLSLLLCY